MVKKRASLRGVLYFLPFVEKTVPIIAVNKLFLTKGWYIMKNTTIVTSLRDAVKVYDFHQKAGDSILGLRLVNGVYGEDCLAIDWEFYDDIADRYVMEKLGNS